MNNTQSIKGKKVFIAMSGGVDSSTAAAILLEAGCDCTGVFMIVHDHAAQHCDDARNIAEHLGIKFEALDLREYFNTVLDYFCSEYKQARTPNPCVFCNRNIKFGRLFDYARSKGADFFATGHYIAVRKDDTGPALYAAPNTAKDQSYALAMIERDVLPYILFPLGDFDKSHTRQIAKKLGLSVSDKADSQEICFIPDNNYAGKLEELCPGVSREGNIIDSSGKVLGTHNGVHHFTIGQRRGARVAMGLPWYVTKLDSTTNTVTLGPAEEIIHKTLLASNPNWLIDKPSQSFAAKIKIRYNHKPVNGTVYPQQDSVKVVFDQPLGAITPGQAAVFYLESPAGLKMAGGAWIDEAMD
ncbi:MAG: tRNA 2-thiouridine(34) synthase MnmA [Planctomycetes bacterium]|nr:tRNA 2-thiouridine(34) synthase MnmA [Planctomycetota bacterium]MBU1517862.1 tRNA 2-thiouridine(34) synthase MnmA [Planctomycetota bacterium]MBU2457998.1 tRNA 2-thiouridine(34) synthase MnmA [Planctomycetota bacterium]MBU2596264.1 tRNA 2-thiouridine(34) synthase MnmA [Planctomycetota bacterium]